MNIKQTILSVSLLAMLLVGVKPVTAQDLAQDPLSTSSATSTIKVDSANLSYITNVYSLLKNFETNTKGFVRRGDITVTTIRGTTITGTQEGGKVYTIDVKSSLIVRKYWSKSVFSHILVGDKIRIIGTWIDEKNMSIKAFLIRDMSTLQRISLINGTVMGISDGGFTFKSKLRNSWSVITTAQTKIVGNKNLRILSSSIQTSDRVSLDGMLDSSTNTLTATTIHDLSYPSKATPSSLLK